ncbi:membrane receptor protein [Colwellia sp. 39_35_sub15_T18]|nr:membrane receptor protein [Colwellia sp. 39_35_sub15_T18]
MAISQWLLAKVKIHITTQTLKLNTGKSIMKVSKIAIALMLTSSCTTFAQEVTNTQEPANEKSSKAKATTNKQVEVISIFGQRNELETAIGSAFVLSEEQLELNEFDDIHRVLQTVPGVYIREEDGYGLRPNIGLRGATSERSSKIALMEDGILIAPAAYAAPAAYYFPLISRMTQVEVFKGPAAIKYGPNTVGGAINMVSRSIASVDDGRQAEIDLAYGETNYQKAHGFYSESYDIENIGELGFLLEGITIKSDGFKDLDTNGGASKGANSDTGFDKSEVIFKANYIPSNTEHYQFWQFKMGYGEEVSHETYLGLTDDDFAQAPTRRYVASENDKMDWEHYQFQVSHYIELNSATSLYTQAYRRDFDRDWDRFNSFNTNRSMATILTSPNTGINALYMQVLTGERDTLTQQERLLFTLNDRKFYSQGIESKLFWDGRWLAADLALDFGLRLHQDQVARNHRQDEYAMQGGHLALIGNRRTITHNKDTATALASYANANLDFGQLNLSAGVRVEYIEGEAINYHLETGSEASKTTNNTTVVMPGFGAFYKITEQWGALFGINKGYVPNSPGQDDNIDPEESWNYEFGLRYSDSSTKAELIGFYNDYSNLKGNCTFSNGCLDELGQEFNAGEVDIYGVEASLNTRFTVSDSLELPINIAYTFTQSEFQNSFQSSFSQWGNVSAGDELPYLPENQLSVEVALAHEHWQVSLLFKYVEKMLEAAGTATELAGYYTDDIGQVDFSSWYQVNDAIRIYGKVDNLTDDTVIVSRRPFGARSGKPRQVIVGIKYTF